MSRLLTLSLVASLILGRQQTVFRGGTDGVLVQCTVLRDGRVVDGLTAADFSLSDNGVRQTILQFSRERIPLDVVALVDASDSVDPAPEFSRARWPRRQKLVEASRRVREVLDGSDTFQLLWFAGSVVNGVPEWSMSPAGSSNTSLYDAIVTLAMESSRPGRHRLIVVLTDGLDTSSIVPHELRTSVIERTDVTITIVASFWPVNSTGGGPFGLLNVWHHHAWELRDIAARTGGRFVDVQPSSLPDAAAQAVQEQARERYLISYEPTDRTPGWHRLDVSTSRRDLEVYHRSGYWRHDSPRERDGRQKQP